MSTFQQRRTATQSTNRGGDSQRAAPVVPPVINVGSAGPEATVPGPAILSPVSLNLGPAGPEETVGGPNVFILNLQQIGSAGPEEWVVGPSIVQTGLSPVPPFTPRITAGLYDRLGNLIVALPATFNRKWQQQISQVGSGEATVQADDTAVASIDYRQILRFSIDTNAVFAAVVEEIDRDVVKPGEEHDQIVTIKGRGTLAVFEEAVVYPELGLGQLPFSDTRTFSYVSTAFDDSRWPKALPIKQQSSGSAPYANAPAVWPDGLAYWIWGQGGPGPYQIGDCFFRKQFALAAETTVRFSFSADDGIEVWLDGARLSQDVQAFLWGTTKTADVYLTAGTHTIAIRGTNIPRPNNATTDIAAVILSAAIVNADGTLGSVVARTDNTWTCLAYPADNAYNTFTDGIETAGSTLVQSASGITGGGGYTFVPSDVGRRVTGGDIPPGAVVTSYVDRHSGNISGPSTSSHTGLGITLYGHPFVPGFTPGAVIRILTTEAQARGALAHVNLGFTDLVDSAGKPWPVMGETSFQVGLDYLSVLLQLAESYIEVAMDVATTTLRAYSTIGADQSTVLAPGTNLTELAFAGKT